MPSPSAPMVRRWLALHRRPVAAGCTFVAVLLAMSALTGTEPSPGGGTTVPSEIAVPDGQLAVPLRLADSGFAELLRPGDRVDVFAAGRLGAEVVASGVTVTETPTTDGGPWTDGAGVVVVLASPEQAAALAGASADSHLTVAVHPR